MPNHQTGSSRVVSVSFQNSPAIHAESDHSALSEQSNVDTKRIENKSVAIA